MEKSTAVVTQELFVIEQLKRFEVKEEDLKALATQYAGLTIKDVNDKEGYQLASASRKILKNKRVEIQKIGKDLRTVANAFNKAVIAREDELVGIIEPVERSLQRMEDAIDEEKDRLRIEEERREDERIQKMIDQFSAVGAAVDYTEIKGMTDEQYTERLQEATDSYAKKLEEEKAERDKLEAERKEEARIRLYKEEREAEERRQQTEANEKERIRLQKIQDEQDQKDREFRAEKDKFDREKREHEEKVRKEAEEKKRLEDLEEAKKKAASDALEAKAKKDEADRLKKIEDDRIAEEKRQEELNEGPDSDRFGFLEQQLDVNYMKSAVWGMFKSKAGKAASAEVFDHLRQAHAICASKMKRRPA